MDLSLFIIDLFKFVLSTFPIYKTQLASLTSQIYEELAIFSEIHLLHINEQDFSFS